MNFSRGFLFLVLLAIFVPQFAAAGSLLSTSDLISNSLPAGTTTRHTITFTATTLIPAGGKIFILPETNNGSSFTIPAGLDFTDIDLAVSVLAGPFVDRTLAATQSATDDGVTISSGAGGTILFTLASGAAAIPAGAVVQIEIGNNASFGAVGDQYIVSPSVVGSYRLRMQTQSAADAMLDNGTAMIALISPVTTSVVAGNVVPPVRTNKLPSGLLPGSTTNVQVSLNTDVSATCKYATTSGVAFFTMSSSTIFTIANAGLLHYSTLAVAQNTIYNLYVRCMNESFITNPDDYLIQFEIGVVPNASSTPPAPPPPPPGPSGPPGPGGGGGLFLKGGDVTIEGKGIPFSTLVVTKDGVVVKEETISSLGTFSQSFQQLARGTYNWGVSLRDADGRKSTTYTSTIYLIGGTNNFIGPVYLSPTVSVASTTIPVGTRVHIKGYAIPLLPVQVLMNKQGEALGSIVSATTTANGNGSWTLSLPTDELAKGTYEIKAQSLVSANDRSVMSPVVYVGVGEDPNPDFKTRSDLNKDNKVNLIDFSILLFHWKTSDATADINRDGTVNLTDFSILLANWTG